MDPLCIVEGCIALCHLPSLLVNILFSPEESNEDDNDGCSRRIQSSSPPVARTSSKVSLVSGRLSGAPTLTGEFDEWFWKWFEDYLFGWHFCRWQAVNFEEWNFPLLGSTFGQQ